MRLVAPAFAFILTLLAACTSASGTRSMPDTALAAGSNRAFSHEVTTTAAPDAVWALWTDASTWSQWDKGLKSASHKGPMAAGSIGQIMPLSGPASKFTVEALVPGQSYRFTTDLPLAKLTVTREIIGTSPTRFRHDVRFSGLMASFWASRFGPGFRAALPPTMNTLARLAEER